MVTPFVVNGDAWKVTAAFATADEGPSGGTDPEDVEHARRYAPITFAARGVAVTKDDYMAAANAFADSQYGAVAKASAVTVRDAEEDATTATLVDEMKVALEDHETTVATDATTVTTGATTLATTIADVTTQRTAAQTQATTITGITTSMKTDVQSIAGQAGSGSAALGLLAGLFDAMSGIRKVTQDMVDGTVTDSDGQTAIEALLVAAETQVAAATTAFSTIVTAAGTTQTNLAAIDTAQATQATALTAIATDETSSSTTTGTMTTAAASLATAAGELTTTGEAKLDELVAALDGLFSADGEANVVSVPILVKDVDGFYVGPSSGLIRRLQEHLDEIKEVTQTVKVISGADSLVDADITVRFKVSLGSVASEVKSNIEKEFDSILKDRDFGDPLRLSDLYGALRDNVVGISYVLIEITGATEYLVDGDLVPIESKIITKGTVTATEIV